VGTLDDKVVIVTGASRGIGRVLALGFAREGARVVVAARSETTGKLPGTIHETAELIRAAGGEALAVRCDLEREDDIRALAAQTLARYGAIDVLVNNAGLNVPRPIASLPTSLWDKIQSVNLRAPFVLSREVLPGMIARRSGSIVMVSSAQARRARPGAAAYAAAKAGLERFAAALAEEVREHGIAVNAIDPGAVTSEGATALVRGRSDTTAWQSPEVVVKPILFLARQTAATFTGRLVLPEDYAKLV
jgi:NAD(P)-dependent dehydrogenase (short-subunit alcohol dehydrogenase family)